MTDSTCAQSTCPCLLSSLSLLRLHPSLALLHSFFFRLPSPCSAPPRFHHTSTLSHDVQQHSVFNPSTSFGLVFFLRVCLPASFHPSISCSLCSSPISVTHHPLPPPPFFFCLCPILFTPTLPLPVSWYMLRSDLKASVNQPRPCASPTLSAAMSLQPHTSGPDGTLTLLVADTASADVDSGPSPALVAPSEQQPRLLDPQSSVLPSVLPSNLGLEVSGLCESDHDRSGSLVVQAGHPPSPPLSASNSLLDSISLSNPIDQIPASPQSATQPSAQEVATPDPAGTTPRSNHHLGLLLQGDRPVNSLPRGTDIDSNRQHAAVPAPSLIQETVIQLQSSPSPTTSTSQPFSAHEHTQSLPDPSRSITQPTQSPHPPPRSLLSGLSADNGNRRADHLHPSPPTSSTSTSVLPNSKRPASPCMTASTAPLNGHQDVGSFGQSNDVNGNTLSVTNENSHKRQKLNDEPTPQQPSSVSSHQVPSSSLHTSATISPALAPTAPSPAPNTASIIPSIMPNETRSDWLIPGTPGTRFTRDQQRFTCSVIKHLKKHRSAPPFVVPVDPVALNILDYPNIIKQPMDLGTVEHRLGKGIVLLSSASLKFYYFGNVN